MVKLDNSQEYVGESSDEMVRALYEFYVDVPFNNTLKCPYCGHQFWISPASTGLNSINRLKRGADWMWSNTTTPVSFIVSLLKKIASVLFIRFLPFTISREDKFYTQGFGVRMYEDRDNKLECNECKKHVELMKLTLIGASF